MEKEGTIYECKARGVFRKDGVSPVVGDHVHIEVQKEGYASIAEICERKNYIVRPPLANIDNLIVVVSTTEPEPNPLIIDKMIAAAEARDIEPIIVFTKTDLKETCGLEEVYANAGFKTFISSEGQDFCRDELIELLKNKTTAQVLKSAKVQMPHQVLPSPSENRHLIQSETQTSIPAR